MALFQNSVLRNYLQNQDTSKALHAYTTYESDFLPKIANTDRKIDTMVYELYGLSEEELAVVEGI